MTAAVKAFRQYPKPLDNDKRWPEFNFEEGVSIPPQAKQVTPTTDKAAKLAYKMNHGKGLLIFNALGGKKTLPASFRWSGSIQMGQGQNLNLKGMDTLNVCGSAQPDEQGMKAVRAMFGPKKRIVLLNLRAEDLVFIKPKKSKGAIACAYLMSMRWWLSAKRTVEEIEASQATRRDELMKRALKKGYIKVRGTNDPEGAYNDAHIVSYEVPINPKKLYSPREMATKVGLEEVRRPIEKFQMQNPKDIDAFINLVKGLSPEDVLWIHCRKGLFRTTMYMILYDIMKNADKATLEEIIARQGPQGLGGSDFAQRFDPKKWDTGYKSGWAEIVKEFYKYAQANQATGFAKSWSEWCKEQNVQLPPNKGLPEDYKGPSIKIMTPRQAEQVIDGKTITLTSTNIGRIAVQQMRTMQDVWQDPSTSINTEGLDSMKMSGSSQYSEVGLMMLLKQIAKRQSPSRIILCDLSNKPQLFIDGMNTWAQKIEADRPTPVSPEEIRDAVKKCQGIKLQSVDARGKKRFDFCLAPTTVETPRELLKRVLKEIEEKSKIKIDASYVHMGIKWNGSIIDDKDVDRLLKELDFSAPDTWIHFHCKDGKTKTTLLMALFDIVHNAHKVSLHDIVARQYALAGVPGREFDAARMAFLEKFHSYAKEEYIPMKAQEVDPQSWSTWSKGG